jgi:hypothetical protein
MTALEKVDFYGDSVFAEKQDDGATVIVAIKPIVERFGLDWSSQLQRIKRDDILSGSVVIITIETPAGPRESVGLPLSLIPGFLFGISEGSIPDPDKRAAVLTYKRHCHEVLYQHFFAPRPAAEGFEILTFGEKLRAVEAASHVGGKAAGKAIWLELGLPDVFGAAAATAGLPRTGGLSGLDFVRQFLADCTVEEPHAQVQAMHLYQAYGQWAGKENAPSITQRAFGMCLEALGCRKQRANVYRYLGIRLKHISERMG